MAVVINNSEANLSTGQTGNGASTNVADRTQPQTFVSARGPALVRIVTAVGATPTCTYVLEGSADGLNWWPVLYSTTATPGTLVNTTSTITTAGTTNLIVAPNQPFKQLRITYSANTNVTNTADVYFF